MEEERCSWRGEEEVEEAFGIRGGGGDPACTVRM